MAVKRTLRVSVGQIDDAVRRRIVTALRDAGQDLRRHVVRIMSGPKHGRVYTRGGKPHIASAPGEPPAIDTGHLASQISPEVDSQRLRLEFGIHDVTGVQYGAYLEFGTRRMAPRPWLEPTWQANRDQIRKEVREAVRAAIRSSTSNGGTVRVTATR